METLFVYVLRLKDGMYYVGTTNDVERRYRQHCEGAGSAWTKLHPPVVLFCQERAVSPFHEDGKVKELMAEHGIDRVRGGSYCQVRLPDEKRAALEEELRHAQGACLRCGRAGHWAAGCYAKTDAAGTPLPDSDGQQPKVRAPAPAENAGPARTRQCSRCGRAGHKAANCFARADAAGGALLPAHASPPSDEASGKKETPVARDTCRRCGRAGHWAADCYARTDSTGAPLSAGRRAPAGSAATIEEPPPPDADTLPSCVVM
jgi:predicted GIY-YIG superfamily endonuclease